MHTSPWVFPRFAAVAVYGLLALAGSAPLAAPVPSVATVNISYHALPDPGRSGIGFLADGRSLFLGGCQPFDVQLRSQPTGCRYPQHIRWGTLSPDGRLLLATTIDARGRNARSHQLDAITGKVLSSRPGLHFVPPVSIHPSNKFWVAVQAGKAPNASETISIMDRSWRVVRRGIYADSSRIYALEFSADGAALFVNGGGNDGQVLDTTTWRSHTPPHQESTPSALVRSADKRWSVQVEGTRLRLIDTFTRKPPTELHLDITDGEPEVAFSPDDRWFAAKGFFTEEGQRKFGFALVELR